MAEKHMTFICPNCGAVDEFFVAFTTINACRIWTYKDANGELNYLHDSCLEDITDGSVTGVEIPETKDPYFFCNACKFHFYNFTSVENAFHCEEEEEEPKEPLDKTFNQENFERYSQIVEDLKKAIVYSKSEGHWYWHDRDEPNCMHGPFMSRWDAVCDIVEPYISEESED